MKFDSQSCVVSGKKQVSVITQSVNWQGQDTLVEIRRGGICGSDLHYYQQGKIGNYQVQTPMVLGHEVVGRIIASDSPHLLPGQTVALNPGKACGKCKYCHYGEENQCTEMRFFGSAMYFPHVNGGFCQYKLVATHQCIPYTRTVDEKIMVFAEPLAVAIHAVNQAGDIHNKRLLISGVGPIGCLVVAVAKVSGAEEIICADVSLRSRQLASEMGASQLIDALQPLPEQFTTEKGYFDVSFEAAGNSQSLNNCIDMTHAKGTIIQVGMTGCCADFPLMKIVAKELMLKGTFRFTDEFNTAVHWLETGVVDPMPLLTAEFPFTELEQALILAGDKSKAAKVQLVF